MTMEPFSGLSSPIRDLRNTDLPVPEGPSRTDTSPGGRVRVTSDQMLARPKDLDSPSTVTSTPAMGAPPWARRAGAAPNLKVLGTCGTLWCASPAGVPGSPSGLRPADPGGFDTYNAICQMKHRERGGFHLDVWESAVGPQLITPVSRKRRQSSVTKNVTCRVSRR